VGVLLHGLMPPHIDESIQPGCAVDAHKFGAERRERQPARAKIRLPCADF